MSEIEERLVFATQGGEYSFHAVAARAIAGSDIEIEEKRRFGEVTKASRQYEPGLGVIAISTVAGTVDDSAREIVRKRPSALPPIVGRVDVPIELALIGANGQTIEDLNLGIGIKCLAQKPAALQCQDFLRTNLHQIKIRMQGESTQAIKDIVEKADPRFVAIGPAFAAEPLGGTIIGPPQINPENSITSFYVLQRDPREQRLPIDPEKTQLRTVISVAHPEGDGEFDKCLKLAESLGIQVARFIPFGIGDFTKHDDTIRRGGGLMEVEHDIYDEEVTEYCARVNGLAGNDYVRGPFDTHKLGVYPWYPEGPIDLQDLAAPYDGDSF